MFTDKETSSNNDHSQLESLQHNELILPRFKCKKCFENGVEPISSIYFDELKDLLEHFDSHDDSTERSRLEKMSQEVNYFENAWTHFKNSINKPLIRKALSPIQANKVLRIGSILLDSNQNDHEKNQSESMTKSNESDMPPFKCKQCLNANNEENDVQPIETIYFEELGDLLKHLDSHDEEIRLEKMNQEVNAFEEVWTNFKNSINKPFKYFQPNKVPKKASFGFDKNSIETRLEGLKAKKRKSISSSLFDNENKKKGKFNKKSNLKSISQEHESQNEESESDSTKDDDQPFLNETCLQKKHLDDQQMLLRKLNDLEESDFIHFNLTMTDLPEFKSENAKPIDEKEISDKIVAMYKGKELRKVDEINKGKIVWVQTKSRRNVFYWPSKVENVIRKSSKLQIVIRYYEGYKLGKHQFKVDLSKVEPFFRPSEMHFHYKSISHSPKEKRLQFLTAYTTALKELKEMIQDESAYLNCEINQETEVTSKKRGRPSMQSTNASNDEIKYSVNFKMMTLDEIKKSALKEPSERLLKTLRDRQSRSENLVHKIKSKECQEYIISILKSETPCTKHTEYLNGDVKTRKALQQIAPGPLIDQDQLEVALLVDELSKTHFKEKPEHLTNYEHDILYPEAVMWALKKMYNISNRKAEEKYLEGFKRTEEEILKQKCNEFLLNQQETSLIGISIQNETINEEINEKEKEEDESLPDLKPNQSSISIDFKEDQ